MTWYVRVRDIQEHVISMEESPFRLWKGKPLFLLLGVSSVAAADE